MKSSVLPASSRLHVGCVVQSRTADVVQPVDGILLLPLPPNPVNVHVVHEKDRVAWGGLNVRHLRISSVSVLHTARCVLNSVTYHTTNISVYTLVRDVGDAIPPRSIGVISIAHLQCCAIGVRNRVLGVPCAAQAVVCVFIARPNVQSEIGKPAIAYAVVRSGSIATKGIRSPH